MAEQHSFTEDYSNPFKFNGKELDEETGMYYYGARYYDPKSSIWMSVDPLAEKYPSWNPYNYCMQNPVNLVDPDGRDVVPWHISKRKHATKGYHAYSFLQAMKEFTKTSYGGGFIKEFLKKDQSIYGVEAQKNGKFSDAILNVYDVKIKNLQEQTVFMGGIGAEGITRFSINNEGKLVVDLFIDSHTSYSEQVETITHELAVHAEKVDYITKVIEQYGVEKAKEYFRLGNITDKDHEALNKNDQSHEGVKQYNNVRRELSSNPEIKKAFDRAAKHRENENSKIKD
ncbi:hypothetical protein GV828_00540 [Flavobacterium sp. NST-5]|uniref:RHS repeat-associated core domain-containing protein n=1 Tax=Flavobacterium ichthyis TaxID=2698827 RepID=A0ABW9Z6D0_9FLAO|nr:RHS repeat-associated core domain-containing protein [Flavobacterium ichthyis]NBL63680.1 hypothetical protein [Flavobacterium ichthyis]